MENRMNITDFFDPYNMEHIKAYQHLIDKGSWPKGFVPENVEYGAQSQINIAFKMSKVWVEQVLAGNVVGMPPVEY